MLVSGLFAPVGVKFQGLIWGKVQGVTNYGWRVHKHECMEIDRKKTSGEKFIGSHRHHIKDAEGDIYTRKETVRRKSEKERGWNQGEAHGRFKTMKMLYF